jgi:CHAT domain-containing protein
MREVTALSVGARLVVLSGCETGLGRVMEIEGTLGFTWAFLSAGASSVGVSLWNVNDRASAEVMERFYSGVGAGRPLAEALANAKRQMLQSTRRAYRHPYFWAPMIVVGLDAALEIHR